MIYYILFDWFNLVPPWLRSYGIVDAEIISQRLGMYGVMNAIVLCLGFAYGIISRSRKEFYSFNPVISIGILYIMWLGCVNFLAVMEIHDHRAYQNSIRWMPIFLICSVIGYASFVFIIPNLFMTYTKSDTLAARLLLGLFLILSLPIYVKHCYWVADMTFMLGQEISDYELKQPLNEGVEGHTGS